MKKEKQPVPIKLPENLKFDSWIVVGLDLSLSRSGYSIGHMENGVFKFLSIGSLKPETASLPVWLRSSVTARALIDQILTVENLLKQGAGLLICLEAFTPQNDFLSAINRILHATFFSAESRLRKYSTHILSVNASTLRSLMGLTKTGAKNKAENIAKAYTYVDKKLFPELDTDSCDAVLLGEMGSYAASILSGSTDKVPERFLVSLCNGTLEVKGKGTRQRIITKGLFHRPEYWYIVKETEVAIKKKDASISTKKLTQLVYAV